MFRSKWVDFSATVINRVYNLVDDDNDAYMALFQDTDYQMITRSLTRGRRVWKHHPSTFEVTTFHMKALTPVPKVWYHFIYATLKPSLHLSTVTRDKTILLYTIMQGIKFDVDNVIEKGIIESTQGRCTGARIHPSLITRLYWLAEVPMHEPEEKSTHRLPVPLLKIKHGDAYDMEAEDVSKEQVEEKLRDDAKDNEAPRDQQQMQVQFTKMS